MGIACRFPQAGDADAFWDNLVQGRNSIREVSVDQWDKETFYSPKPMEPGRINTKWVGRLAGSRCFDNAFFNVSPREAVAIDPQYRVLLEEAWHCVEDSGLPLELLQSARTSVNVGLLAQDYLIKGVSNNKRVDAFGPAGNYPSMASNRISHLLDLDGPSRTVDTACSASLAALGQGRNDLLHEGCDFALVGAVNLICSPWRYLALTQSRMLSPDGRSFTFDCRANGYVPGEGAGMVLLTTVTNAERLGCHIYGVIKGLATNHNGRNRNLTAPSAAAQVDVIRRALADAGVAAADVSYVEAHGTGTSLGDPIEVEALNVTYGQDRAAPLLVGSVKTNIGHVEAGAGMAGLIKVLQMLRHGTVPPTLNRSVTNPLIQGEGESVEFPSEAVEWKSDSGLRTAGISSFGFGGVNCHAIVQEYQGKPVPREDAKPVTTQVFTVAAKTPGALRATLEAWAREPRWSDPNAVAALCRASNRRMLTLPYRFGVAAADLPALEPAQIVRELTNLRPVERVPELAVLLADAAPGAAAAPRAEHDDLVREIHAVAGPAAQAHRELLDGFADRLAGLRTLARYGVVPVELAAVGVASGAAALVHAGTVPLPEAVRGLIGDGTATIQAPPDHGLLVGGERLLPNELTGDYLRELVDARADTREDVAPYARHAALLLDYQHTFARAVGRWEKVAGEHGFSVADAIRGFDDGAPSRHTLATVALVVDVAISEIDQAWGLTPAPWLRPAIHELATLVRRSIIEPADAVAALFGDADLDKLAAGAREHLAVRSAPLADLPVLRRRTHECNAGRRVALAGSESALVLLDATRARADCVLVLGETPTPDGDDVVRMAGAEPTAALLELWRRGCAIDWAESEPVESPHLPGLPTYVFDRHAYWIEDDALRIDGREPPGEPAAPREPAEDEPALKAPVAKAPVANEPTPKEPVVNEPAAAVPEPAPRRDEDILDRLRDLLCRLVAEATKTPAASIGPDTPFADLGIDSLIIHALNTRLSAWFGDIAATLFYECRDVGELAVRIWRDYDAAVTAHLGAEQPPSTPVPDVQAVVPQRDSVPVPVPRAARVTDTETAAGIAIVGLDGRFPGADTPAEFWANLCEGRDSVTDIPASRWDHSRYFDARRDVPEKVYAKWGGFLSDVDHFDAAAFGIAPDEARFMDPQERLFLEAAHNCLEVGGYPRERLREVHDNEVGVFVGATFNNYQLVQYEAELAGAPASSINSQTFAIANRVSFTYDLRGPSLTLDTACASALNAIHLACESLRRGECSLAIAGGVNLSLHPSKYQMLARYQFLSSDGRCRAFGEGGDGYVPAESVGAFLLKPLSHAERDGDRIYGVIRGSALTHGGRTNGFTVPNPTAQAAAIERALRQADVDPGTISYIEAHGTGTRLGDPIEIAGITAAFGRQRKQYCSIGSVKSNIGHAEAAAGVAQVAKVVLQLQNRTLVPSLLHADRTNPDIDFANSPVFVQSTLREWDPAAMGLGAAPRRAGVTSIGAGGTNVHLVMEEYR